MSPERDPERLLQRVVDSYRQWCEAFPEWVDEEDRYLLNLLAERDVAGWVPPEEAEALREKCDWWRDLQSSLLALIDAHFDLTPGMVSDHDRLQQVQQELRDQGVEWESDWSSDNERLWKRAETAEARVRELESSWVPPERVETIDCPARTQLDSLTAPELVHPPIGCRCCGGSGKLQIVRAE